MAEDVQTLIQALSSADPNKRWATAVSLGVLGDRHALGALVVALGDPSVHVRVNVAEALGKIGEPAISALCNALRDRSISVARNAAKALVKIGDPAVDALCITLMGANTHARQLAAIALGEIGNSRVVIALCNALADDDETVRWNSVEALKLLGDRDTLVRSILINSQMMTLAKVAALNALRKAKYYPNRKVYGSRSADARIYCEQMMDDSDLCVRQAAVEMLRYLAGDTLVRPSGPNDDELVRPLQTDQPSASDLSLPRTADAPATGALMSPEIDPASHAEDGKRTGER